MTLAKNVMLDISATAVAFFSKRLKLQMSNGVLMVHDMCYGPDFRARDV